MMFSSRRVLSRVVKVRFGLDLEDILLSCVSTLNFRRLY